MNQDRGGDGENVQAQQFEGESKTDESAISISRSLPNRNTSKKTYQFNHSTSKYTNVYLNAVDIIINILIIEIYIFCSLACFLQVLMPRVYSKMLTDTI